MLSFLKHISVRIWLTVLLGGVVCLWVLPSFQAQIGLQWVLLPVVLILVAAVSALVLRWQGTGSQALRYGATWLAIFVGLLAWPISLLVFILVRHVASKQKTR